MYDDCCLTVYSLPSLRQGGTVYSASLNKYIYLTEQVLRSASIDRVCKQTVYRSASARRTKQVPSLRSARLPVHAKQVLTASKGG
jgi:hypothetical protein